MAQGHPNDDGKLETMSEYSRPLPDENWGYRRPSGMRGVLMSRIFAFFVDVIIITVLFYIFFMLFAILGFVTFGLTWFLIPPLFWLTALLYNGITISGRKRSTLGMRLFGIELVHVDGGPLSFLTAAVHAVLFYISWTILTPFILLIGLMRDDRRMLHDLLTGAIAYRTYD
jgi:uncharacterized RDD family membrane protein YckC